MLTVGESIQILENEDALDNLLAMLSTKREMKRRHSDIVLKSGSAYVNALAVKLTEGKMRRRHEDRVSELKSK